MATRITVTLERNPISGAWKAYWTDRRGFLVQRTYIGFTKREALRDARAEANARSQSEHRS